MTAMSRDAGDLTLRTLMIGARLDDYVALKCIYAVEIARFWKQASESRTRNDVNGLLYRETSDRYHTRTSDLMDAVSELRGRFAQVWRAEYTEFRLQGTLDKFDLEFQYWWKVQMRIRELTEHYHNGDALPALTSMTGAGMGE